jgi:phospholipase C
MRFRVRPLNLAIAALTLGFAATTFADDGLATRTPIEHLIVVIGENHTFDNLFGAFQPARGQSVANLLSQGIITVGGLPGPNFNKALQKQAMGQAKYSITPVEAGPFAVLPQPQTTYATGLPGGVADSRFPANLPPGPFQITHYVPYSAYLGDPPHRFFQMWQQVNGGKSDLFAWVDVTAGIGPDNSFNPPDFGPGKTYQGGEALGFYNMAAGDAPGFAALARRYAISDNYHQAVMGGTGANFLALATADVAYFTQNGAAAKPFPNQIENPDPKADTDNFYTHDGYTGGSYVNCADTSQPGVAAIHDYEDTLGYDVFRGGNCAKDTYYLVNNYGLAYAFDGREKPIAANTFTLPPQVIPTIADALSAKKVSWKWYSGGREAGATTGEYCGICDPLTGFKSIMTTALKANLQGMPEFYGDVAVNTLPAVSFVRPFESEAGHPANATMPDFESFVTDLVSRVQANPALWAKTAILVTVDEGGGYYDSGYVQAIDFFGDGTRIPMIAVSKYAKPGFVDHTYYDHASIAKFVERNWRLGPLSARSRDNLPNPVHGTDNPYVPANRPAIGDLMNLFTFGPDGESQTGE